MAAGAPHGNRNAAKGASAADAIRRALERAAKAKSDNPNDAKTRATLDNIADKLIEKAAAGEEWAIKELFNRLDGKSVQGVIDYTPPPSKPPVLMIGFEMGAPGQLTAQSEDDAAGTSPESP